MRKLITLFLAINLLLVNFLWAAEFKEQTPGDDVLEITADRLDVFAQKGEAVFMGNVEAVRSGMTMNSRVLRLFFSDETKQVYRFEAEDNVHITWEDKEASCDKADYLLEKELMTLTGNVLITRGKEKIAGDRVVVDNAKDRQTVEGGDGRVKLRVNTGNDSGILKWE